MSEKEINLEIDKLKEAFKPIVDILSPYSQEGEIIEYEKSLIINYKRLLKLKEEMYKVQKDIQLDSFKMNSIQKKHIEYLKLK